MGRIGERAVRATREGASLWTRRQLLVGAGAAVGSTWLSPRLLRAADGFTVPQATREALAASPLVYVSPLQSNGSESSCHGEVWYFVDEGGVVVFTAADRWKARAIRQGRDRARLWVGNFGPVKKAGDRYRSAPTFLASAVVDTSPAVFQRLMGDFAKRYASEWGKWGPRFQNGWDDGTRVMVRYTPIGA